MAFPGSRSALVGMVVVGRPRGSCRFLGVCLWGSSHLTPSPCLSFPVCHRPVVVASLRVAGISNIRLCRYFIDLCEQPDFVFVPSWKHSFACLLLSVPSCSLSGLLHLGILDVETSGLHVFDIYMWVLPVLLGV